MAASSSLRPGARVTLVGLVRRADLNGTVGELLQYTARQERWVTLCLTTNERGLLRPQNLRPGAEDFCTLLASNDDVLMAIQQALSPAELVGSIAVCRAWAALATADAAWQPRCEELWYGKLHTEQWHRSEGLARIAAYWLSLYDSERVALTPAELVGLRWWARVKEESLMTHGCPWWNDLPAGTRHYTLVGSAAETGAPQEGRGPAEADEATEARPHGTYASSERGVGEWAIVAPQLQRPDDPTIVWCSRGPISFDPHVSSRHPQNWGWLLQNMHGLSASFPLPPRASPSASDLALELSADDGPHDINLSQAYSHARMRHELRHSLRREHERGMERMVEVEATEAELEVEVEVTPWFCKAHWTERVEWSRFGVIPPWERSWQQEEEGEEMEEVDSGGVEEEEVQEVREEAVEEEGMEERAIA